MTPSNENPSAYWLRQLDREERSTLIATFAGWMLDGMDVMIYSFVMPTLILVWHIGKAQAGLLATSTLLLSSVGGWLAGMAADRWGRVRVLQLTVVWFAVFTFLGGFTTSFHQLLWTRGLQGLGFGGEWAVGSVLIGERIRSAYRGRAVGTTQAGWAIGWGLAALFYIAGFHLLPPDLAWRALFWIGLLPALLAIWVRRHVHEPEIYRAARQRAPIGNPLAIFSPGHVRLTALASLLALGAQGGYYAITTFLPLYLNTRGLSVTATGLYTLVVVGGSFAGYLTSAHLADALGRRKTLLLFALGALVAVSVYTLFPLSNVLTLVLGFPLGFFSSGSFGPMGSLFTELFPTPMRGSGQGFSYNFGRGVGAILPTLVGILSARMSLPYAISTLALAAYAVMALSTILLPETRGRALG